MNNLICGDHAAFRYTWPGRDESFCCVEHGLQLMKLADAMGLGLQFIPLSYKVTGPIPTEFPVCQQKGQDEEKS